jgi:hypothetical protein
MRFGAANFGKKIAERTDSFDYRTTLARRCGY